MSDFKLRNDLPKRPTAEFGNIPMRQRKLFAGLDCLPGQGFLFETDGEPPDDTNQVPAVDRAAG